MHLTRLAAVQLDWRGGFNGYASAAGPLALRIEIDGGQDGRPKVVTPKVEVNPEMCFPQLGLHIYPMRYARQTATMPRTENWSCKVKQRKASFVNSRARQEPRIEATN